MNERTDEKATDVEVALRLAGHIAYPCTDREGWSLKRGYMEEARLFIAETENEIARRIIGSVLKVYSD